MAPIIKYIRQTCSVLYISRDRHSLHWKCRVRVYWQTMPGVEAILVRSVITDTSVCELSRHIFYAAISFVLLAFSNFVSYHFLCVQVFTLPSIS